MAMTDEGWGRRVGRRRLVPVAVLAVASVLGTAWAENDRPPLTFEARVEAVNLNVTVTQGSRFVPSLEERDFAVFEDGVRQDVALFSREEQPISLAIMIDSSASMASILPVVEAAALRLVRTLTPRDRAEVIQFNERTAVLQGFTSDPAALEAAVESVQASGATSLYTALYVALKDLAPGRGSELRRRAIVVLTDGEDTNSAVRDEDVLREAAKGDIVVYPIGLRRSDDGNSADKADLAVYFLNALAAQTGGEAHFPGAVSELDGIYDRIGRELRMQYSLGYVPSNARRDGRWRRIGILTPSLQDVQIRCKRGYYGPSR
jgi:Ca-activated chloride channel homolog